MVKPRLWRSIRTANLRSAIMSNAQCRMPNAECRMPNAECQCRMPNAECEIFKVGTATGIRFCVLAALKLNCCAICGRFLRGIRRALDAFAMESPPYDIQERTFVFSCRVIDFCRPLFRGDPIDRHLAGQLLHASTSVGANLEEADAGHTKPDFRNKVSTSRKECREARYWLRLIAYSKPHLQAHAEPLIDEASQLVKILTTIKLNSEDNSDRG